MRTNKIGSGTYGTVYRAINRETDEVVAIKKIKIAPQVGFSITTVREVTILNELKRSSAELQNIVDLKEVVFDKEKPNVYLIFEHCPFDLEQFMGQMHSQSLFFNLADIKSIIF